MSEESGNREESAHERAVHVQRSVEVPSARKGVTVSRSASLAPLLVLYQQAWECAQRMNLSLEQLQRAAEAALLAGVISHLLAVAGDLAGHERWMVRLSEARQWLAAVHDGLTQSEDVKG
ncbi:MAG: hypothetical protein SGJ26_01460 [Nitrospirota bacterium]|nr:hypothetical protein [Nitrospirota bacterium]